MNNRLMFKKTFGISVGLIEISFVITSVLRFFTGGWTRGLWFHVLTLTVLCLFLLVPMSFYYFARDDVARKDEISLHSLRSFACLFFAFVFMVVAQILWAFSSPSISSKYLIVFRWLEWGFFVLVVYFQIHLILSQLSFFQRIEGDT